MARPVTLFTGQWADLPLSELAPMAKKMGFDGLELACWGDHFDVYKAAESKDYCHGRWKILTDNGLTAFGISNHLVGQAICDHIDERHQAIVPPQVWGDGHPEGVRQRAAENMQTAARATNVVNDLLDCGVWIRMPGAPPLDRYVRVSAGTGPMRLAFAAALRSVLAGVQT